MFVCMTNKDSLKMDVAVVKGNHALPPVFPLIWRFCKLISNAITSSTSVFWSQVSIYGFPYWRRVVALMGMPKASPVESGNLRAYELDASTITELKQS
ncbi:hypothetical protein Peur_039844 [Populus x canadensis]